jgi:hypothetical protein
MAQRLPLSKARQKRLPKVCRRILGYLAENPDAGDTEEGILQWWLMERALIEARPVVEAALTRLVELGWVLVSRAQDSRRHYRLNQQKREEIHQFLQGAKSS